MVMFFHEKLEFVLFLLGQGDVPDQHAIQLLQGVRGFFTGLVQTEEEIVPTGLDDGEKEILFVLEVVIDRRNAHVEGMGNIPDGSPCITLLSKKVGGHIDNLSPFELRGFLHLPSSFQGLVFTRLSQ
jgi:hypothetical protein